ncbi:MAG: transposase [Bacteroidales bacterium]|nr:transposase [Bacteroidales bacterium]
MSTKYKIKDQNAAHFVTMTIVGWIDIFTRKIYREIVLDSFKYCQKEKGLEIFGYVIMSNHIHLIARAKEKNSLSDVLRDFKKFTSKQMILAIQEEPESRREWMLKLFAVAGKSNSNNKDFQIWQQDNHAVVLYSNGFIIEKLDYIHNNPVRSGIVENPKDYLFSSARNYEDLEGLLEVIRLTRPLNR